MKYVTLAFDDGLQDFIDNAEPLLLKYGFKATLNLVSGFLDGTYNKSSFNKIFYATFDVDDAKRLKKDGNEINMHSESHIYPETLDDFYTCFKKFLSFFGDERYGVTMPYNQSFSKELEGFFVEIKVPFVALGKINPRKDFRHYCHIFFYRSNRFLRANYPFINYISDKQKHPFYMIKRIDVSIYNSPDDFIDLIKHMPNDSYLIITFHCILRDNQTTDNCPYPEGVWFVSQFEKLLCFLRGDKTINVISHMDWVRILTRN